MDFKEIKTITYTVCAATLTVVASICGIALTAKTCGVINNCEKITKHAANVGEMIDDKQFAEDVKKDIKNATKGHAEAAEHLAAVTKGWTEPSKPGDMGHTTKQILNNLNEASSELNGCAHKLNGPSQPGDMGYNWNQFSASLPSAVKRLDRALQTAHVRFLSADTRNDAEVEAARQAANANDQHVLGAGGNPADVNAANSEHGSGCHIM